MSIPLPNLDDRRWRDLAEEGRKLIPVYAPEWTDHNVHDPGITLIELFAWLAEMDLYRLNRIPEPHKRKFLSLIGVGLKTPQLSCTNLSLALQNNAPPLSLPATVEFAGNNALGQETRFRTLEPITVAPTQLQVVQVKDVDGFHHVTDQLLRKESVAIFGAIPEPEAELYLGFSEALPLAVPVSLFFTFGGSHAGEEERRRLIQETRASQSALSQTLIDGLPVAPELQKIPPHHDVKTEWEYLSSVEPEEWRPLDPRNGEVDDDTRAFTLDGRVTIKLPADVVKARLGSSAQELFYLRCRFANGDYDAPPVLKNIAINGVRAEQAIPAGQVRWTIAQGAALTGKTPVPGETVSCRPTFNELGQISMLDVGDQDPAVPSFLVLDFQAATPTQTGIFSIEAIFLDLGTGRPHQELTLIEAPVQESSFQLFTLEQNEWRVWHARPDFDVSTRTDAHFSLEPATGRILFGDGEKGRVPPLGALLLATCRVTRAEAGNLVAGAINQLIDSPHNRAVLKNFDAVKGQFAAIFNPMAAHGGAAAETLFHTIGRALEMVQTPQRAVTLQDYERLALETPGTQIARVSVRANFDPNIRQKKNPSPGTNTVMILPEMPISNPQPSAGLRQAVKTYLHHRRVIGTDVEVIGPTYLKIAVRASVKARPGVNKTDLRQNIEEALNTFFDPFAGGPERTGWPLGRDVYRSEVLQVIDEVLGVDHVLTLALILNGGQPQSGNVPMPSTSLAEAGEHQIEVVL